MTFGLPLILIGATTTVLGRHSILGLTIGCGMMLVGWASIEWREARG